MHFTLTLIGSHFKSSLLSSSVNSAVAFHVMCSSARSFWNSAFREEEVTKIDVLDFAYHFKFCDLFLTQTLGTRAK